MLTALSTVAGSSAPLAGVGTWLAPKALLMFEAAAALVWSGLVWSGLVWALAAHAPHPRFGAANAITLASGALPDIRIEVDKNSVFSNPVKRDQHLICTKPARE